MKKHFWMFNQVQDGECCLRLDGEIAEESWLGDEITPKQFSDELAQFSGQDLTVWINSPGGDMVAGSLIYTALKEHDGIVTIKIDGLAASAASVIAMAGDSVSMSPTSLMMIHDPVTLAYGSVDDLEQGIAMLEQCKESIINAYCLKTGISRAKVARLMSDETWMNAKKAVELGFADRILYTGTEIPNSADAYLFSRQTSLHRLLAKCKTTIPVEAVTSAEELNDLSMLEQTRYRFDIL